MERIFSKAAAIAAVLCAAVALAVSAAPSPSGKDRGKTDGQGHELIALWKEYGSLKEQDRPDRETAVLQDIISQARKRRLPWDFYDGWRKYRDTELSRNWKMRGQLDSSMTASIMEFDEPVVTYRRMLDERAYSGDADTLVSFARKNASRLKAASNPAFYTSGYYDSFSSRYIPFPESVAESIADDYEYVLWSALTSSGAGAGSELWDMLSDYISGSYPDGAYLEFYRIMALYPAGERRAALEEYAVKHAGQAVSLFACQELINEEFADLQSSDSASSGAFMALREKCRLFENSRRKFSGSEKKIADDCDAVESLIKTLDGRSIRIEAAEDTLYVQLRNIGVFNMDIMSEGQDSVLYSADFENRKKSYFVYDTVSVVFPVPDDGDYTVRCSSGDIRTASLYSRRSVSLAYRRDGEGIAVYAADRKSGRPLESADIAIYRKDTLVCSFRNMKFDGFVPLGTDIFSKAESGRPGYRMTCSFRDSDGVFKKSPDVYPVYTYGGTVSTAGSRVYGVILKDRAVFSPGDTLHFKTILYKEDSSDGHDSGYSVLGPGEKADVIMYGPKRTKIDSTVLDLNEFGSASGAFPIPEGQLGGRYSLDVVYDGHVVTSGYFVAGDIVIPTFDLEFDPCDTIYFPGDSIAVSGRIHSYSGHNLNEADMRWTVYGGRSGRISGTVFPDAEGRFSFGFRDSTSADRSSYYNIAVRVTDATGETLEFNGNVTVAPRFTLDVVYDNPAEGSLFLSAGSWSGPMTGYGAAVMDGDKADMRFVIRNSDWQQTEYPEVAYSVCKGGRTLLEGRAMSGDVVTVDLSGYESGLYRLNAEAEADMKMPDGRDSSIVFRYSYDFVKLSDDDTVLDFNVDYLFRKAGDGNDIAMQLGSSEGPVWAVVELWGDKADKPLLSRLVCFGGSPGSEESLVTVRFPFEDSYPDDVRMSVFYFKDGTDRRYSAEYHRKISDMALPLEFVSFADSAQPGETVTMTFKTSPSSESAVTVFDAASEQIMSNGWGPVWLWSEVPYANIYAYNGVNSIRSLLSRSEGSMLFKNAGIAAMAPDMDMAADMEESSVVQNYAGSVSADLEIRDEFDNTLAFIPSLRSGADSTVTFSFRTSDKLSTYRVSVFSHDKDMRSNTASREFMVTKPVMVSVAAPGFLHEGDIYALEAVASNNSDMDIEGVLNLYLYVNEDYESSVPVMVCSRPADVVPGGKKKESFVVEVPSGVEVMGFKLVFEGHPVYTDRAGWKPEEGAVRSDGLFVSVPVYPGRQQLVETHSAVLLPGMDPDSLKSVLAGQFVNTLPYGASSERISLIDMILKAVPEKAAVKGSDAVSLSDALYVRMLSGCLPGGPAVDDLVMKILDCQNPDGGFGWFAGMKSSAGVTALLLERISELRGRTHTGIVDDAVVDKALQYLDKVMLGSYSDRAAVPVSGISMPEYLYVRSMYAAVPLAGAEMTGCTGKDMASFRKDVVEYMTAPTGASMFDGRLLDKARRASAAMDLLENSESALAGGLGLKKGKLRKVSRALDADMASICSYAVEHPSGGMYYPNAVMSRYGLLESELYAHTLICDLLSRYAGNTSVLADRASEIADGLRLWMMIQKETQQWDDDPAFVHAIASVLDGSGELLETEIVILSKRYEKPFGEIRAAGNGFKVTRQYFIEKTPVSGSCRGQSGDILEEIGQGDTLRVGDKIVCRYTVWSGENRSFVKLTVPRNAAMRPVDQISGMTGWWGRPLLVAGTGVSGLWNPVPSGYRDVESDRTVYYFDVFPEENTVIEEVFFVTQSGEFLSAIPEVECVYAPHYRANAGFDGRMAVE